MFGSVFVVMMGFRRSVRMGSGVHAKKNLPHQLLKDKASLQSAKCGFSSERSGWRRDMFPSPPDMEAIICRLGQRPYGSILHQYRSPDRAIQCAAHRLLICPHLNPLPRGEEDAKRLVRVGFGRRGGDWC